jgi:hypothetical protein
MTQHQVPRERKDSLVMVETENHLMVVGNRSVAVKLLVVNRFVAVGLLVVKVNHVVVVKLREEKGNRLGCGAWELLVED